MTSKLENSVKDFDKKQAKDVPEIAGLLGLAIGGSKQVEVPNRNAYVYVRLRENQNEVIQAFNETVSPVYDMPVKVLRRGNSYYVKGRDTNRYVDWGSSAPYLPLHGNSHSFNPEAGGGGDLVFVYPRQFMPALCIPSGTDGGPNVIVTDYNLKTSGGWLHIGPTGTDNILQYKPLDNTAVMGLVYIDSVSGNPYFIINSGTTFANTITGSAEIVPYLPTISNSAWIPDMAIRLASGTASIGWDNMYDVRQFLGGNAGGGGGSGTFPVLDPNVMVITDGSGLPISGPVTTFDTGLNLVEFNANVQIDGTLQVNNGVNINSPATYDIDNIPHTHTGTGGGFPDAPFDKYVYGRHSGTWDIVEDKYWIIYPDQITSQLDDWTPALYDDTTKVIEVFSDATQNITGLTGGVPYRGIYFYNIGSFDIILKEHDGSSASQNQFDMYFFGSVDYTLNPGKWVFFQYESRGGGDWLCWSDGVLPTDLPMNRLAIMDALGRISDSEILSFNSTDKQLVLGDNGNFLDIIGGGVSFHIVDDVGSSGGEEFLWAYGTGTLGRPADTYEGRHWFVRARGDRYNPLPIVDGDELGQVIPLAVGDNGNWNADSEGGAQPETTHRANLTFRAVGAHDNTSRAVQAEIWTTPSGTLVRQEAFVVQDSGGVNLPSGTSTYNIAGIPHSHGSASAFGRSLSSDLTLANTYCLVIKSYIKLNSYIINLQGDAELLIL